MTTWKVTVRYGDRGHRYHTFEVDAPSARDALERGAGRIPDEVSDAADLVELRLAIEPEERKYVGEDG